MRNVNTIMVTVDQIMQFIPFRSEGLNANNLFIWKLVLSRKFL